jgi:hypothetical protein
MTAAKKIALYQDLFSIPEHHVGQIVFGVLHTAPRPAMAHANAATRESAVQVRVARPATSTCKHVLTFVM